MAKDLIAAIKEKQALISRLQAELDEAKALLLGNRDSPVLERRDLAEHTRRKARGRKRAHFLPYKSGSSVGRAAKILRDAGEPLHVDFLLSKMKGKVKKNTLVGNLSRYVKQGTVFCRTAPGTFGLIEWKKNQSEVPKVESAAA